MAVPAAVLLSSLTTLTAPAILRGTLGDVFDPLDGLAFAAYVCLGGVFGLLASRYLDSGRWSAAAFSLALVVFGLVMGVLRYYRGE